MKRYGAATLEALAFLLLVVNAPRPLATIAAGILLASVSLRVFALLDRRRQERGKQERLKEAVRLWRERSL